MLKCPLDVNINQPIVERSVEKIRKLSLKCNIFVIDKTTVGYEYRTETIRAGGFAAKCPGLIGRGNHGLDV